MSYENNNIYMNYRSGSLNLNSSWAGKSLLEALSKLPDISVNDEVCWFDWIFMGNLYRLFFSFTNYLYIKENIVTYMYLLINICI